MSNWDRLHDIGMVDPAKITGETAYVSFGAVRLHNHPIDPETGHSMQVYVPIPLQTLRSAGIELDNPDPYNNPGKIIFFSAEVQTPVEKVEDADPTNIEPMPHMSAESIDAWEGKL